MNAFQIKYRPNSGVTITPVTGEIGVGGVFTTRMAHGYYQNISPKEWDATLEGAKTKAWVIWNKEVGRLRKWMAKLYETPIELPQ